MQVTIRLEYSDEATAKAIAKAVSPDNLKVPNGLVVKTCLEGNEVVTEITLEGKLSTFIATIDDLLESVSTAEKALHVVRRK